jgi:hypothetical protein
MAICDFIGALFKYTLKSPRNRQKEVKIMKVKQINKVKVKIFEEEELKEKLGLEQKQIKLIIDYQETFPELLQDDIEGFIIDSRKLYTQLKLQQDFSHWIKYQIKNLELEEGRSYTLCIFV